MNERTARRQISPASLVIARAGITQEQLARLTGQARAYVGDQLTGRRRPTPALFPVIAALAGPELAAEIEELLRDRWAEDGDPIRPAQPRRRPQRSPRRLPFSEVERLWTLEETAAYLAVPQRTVYSWRSRGEGHRQQRLGGISGGIRRWCVLGWPPIRLEALGSPTSRRGSVSA